MSFSPEPRNANDDLDDLFDYDIDEADLQTLDISVPAPRSPPPATRTEKEDVLGLDAEVKVKKTRGPAVKLDEKRYDTTCFGDKNAPANGRADFWATEDFQSYGKKPRKFSSSRGKAMNTAMPRNSYLTTNTGRTSFSAKANSAIHSPSLRKSVIRGL